MATWTAADQKALDDLQKRREEFYRVNKIKLGAVLSGIVGPEDFGAMTDNRIADRMIENADALRDALAPFDSGVRTRADYPPVPEPGWMCHDGTNVVPVRFGTVVDVLLRDGTEK